MRETPAGAAQVSRSRMEYLPHLSRRERDRRWAGLREGMRAARLDAVLVHGSDVFMGYGMANFRYLTQIGGHHGGFALFGHDGPPVIFHPPPPPHPPHNPRASRCRRPNSRMPPTYRRVCGW